MRHLLWSSLCALALVTLGACGGDSSGGGEPGGDAGGGGQVACECGGATCGVNPCGEPCGTCETGQLCREGACDAAGFCTLADFAPEAQAATARITEKMTTVRFEASGGPVFDRVVVETRRGAGHDGPAGQGLYPVSKVAAECDLCVTAYADCVDGECLKMFAAREGAVYLEAGGGQGERFSGSLHGMVFEESYLDPKTGAGYPLPAGDVVCLDSVAFDADVEDVVIEGHCDELGTGTRLGDQIRNIELLSATGDMVPLHDRCGTKAVLVVAVAGYCGVCEAFVPEAKAMYEDHADEGMALMVVVGEDEKGEPATLEYCQAYADAKELPRDLVFCDGGESNGWSTLFSAVDTYSSGTISLPFDALLYGDTMEYVWCNQEGDTSLEQELAELLAR